MAHHERVGIIGTAASWVKTPWKDQGMYLYSLNDAYRMKGFQRADRWYDLHPVEKMFFLAPDQPLTPTTVPPGHYVRPAGHVEWLARNAQAIDVYVHHDFAQTVPAMSTWPKGHAFDKAEVEAHHGRYFTSSPAWMMAHAIMEGVKELYIYGIHLATEFEYVQQRPNFEFLCGRILGGGRLKETVKDGMRYYETRNGLVALPTESPVLSSDFQYAYDARPDAGEGPLKWDMHRFTVKRERAAKALATRRWWTRARPLQEDFLTWDAHLADVRERIARRDAAQHWS